MKNLLYFGIMLFAFASCREDLNSVNDSSGNMPLASGAPVYDIMLNSSSSLKIGTLSGGVVNLSFLEFPESFTYDSKTFDVISVSSIGGLYSNDSSNMYITITTTDSDGESFLYAAPVDITDPNTSTTFRRACGSDTHTCTGNNCNKCSFDKDNSGCIVGCLCLSTHPAQVDGTCDHTVSTGGSGSGGIIGHIASLIEDSSTPI